MKHTKALNQYGRVCGQAGIERWSVDVAAIDTKTFELSVKNPNGGEEIAHCGPQPPKSEFIYDEKPGYVRFFQIRDFGSDKNINFIRHSKKNRQCDENDILNGGDPPELLGAEHLH